MSREPILAVRDLRKTYRLYAKPAHRLLELLTWNRLRRHAEKHALDDVSFFLEPGDRLGIMGENGSGKSTLLKVLTGVLAPTTGEVVVNGSISALLELGTGFHPELTGRENVFQNGYIMGFSHEEMESRYPSIAQFSELGEAIEYPVKTYSSGMLMRLGFSCAVFVQPDILIVDEALSVGDAYFQTKCFYKIKSMIEGGTTFLYVSHGQDSIRTLCNKAIVLEHGHIIFKGDSASATDFYASYIYKKQVSSSWNPPAVSRTPGADENAIEAPGASAPSVLFTVSESFADRVAELRQGTGQARITDLRLLGPDGLDCDMVEHGQTLTVRVCFEAHTPLSPGVSLGVGLCDATGVQILQCSSHDEGVDLSSPEAGARFVVDFSCVTILAPGKYSVTAGLCELTPDKTLVKHDVIDVVYDVCFGGAVFSVIAPLSKPIWGKVSHHFDVAAYAR